MKLALWSATPALGNVKANIQRVANAAMAKEADIVVFPELFLTGYMVGDDLQRLAFRDNDVRLVPLVQAARKSHSHIVVGLPRTPRTGITHNSAMMIRPDGSVEWYDKRCLPTFTTFQEGLWFKAGEDNPVWKADVAGNADWSLAPSICYDLFFPEFQKEQVLRGADLILNVSASPATSRRFFEVLVQARAIENACFAAYSNNVGAQDNLVFWGGSHAVGPRGQILASMDPYKEGRVVVELDASDLSSAREFRPTLRDSHLADSRKTASLEREDDMPEQPAAATPATKRSKPDRAALRPKPAPKGRNR